MIRSPSAHHLTTLPSGGDGKSPFISSPTLANHPQTEYKETRYSSAATRFLKAFALHTNSTLRASKSRKSESGETHHCFQNTICIVHTCFHRRCENDFYIRLIEIITRFTIRRKWSRGNIGDLEGSRYTYSLLPRDPFLAPSDIISRKWHVRSLCGLSYTLKVCVSQVLVSILFRHLRTLTIRANQRCYIYQYIRFSSYLSYRFGGILPPVLHSLRLRWRFTKIFLASQYHKAAILATLYEYPQALRTNNFSRNTTSG